MRKRKFRRGGIRRSRRRRAVVVLIGGDEIGGFCIKELKRVVKRG